MSYRSISPKQILTNSRYPITKKFLGSTTETQRVVKRNYAEPAKLSVSNRVAFKAPPAPVKPPVSIEDGHATGNMQTTDGSFDQFLEETALQLFNPHATAVSSLYAQYRQRAGRTLDLVIPYEERPARPRRADLSPQSITEHSVEVGDGLVMVVHVLLNDNGKVDKVCACSGFAVDARPVNQGDAVPEVIITCAHTLEEMYRHLKTAGDNPRNSFSLIISSDGRARLVNQVLSSMPRSDVLALEISSSVTRSEDKKLRTLPLSPFPVYNGNGILTHLFAASEPPSITKSESRLPPCVKEVTDVNVVQTPTGWLQNKSWRRWGVGVMLGYRSYTGIEVEAGIHSSLPHMQTSILPTPGSSGGPLVCAETGAVVGMISGRRMDNRVEGERGWGTSAEGIFEMFSLPGFVPTGTGCNG